jgi:cholesterol oxidase
VPRLGGDSYSYLVRYVRHEPAHEGNPPDSTRNLKEHTITTDQLVLAAGTLGTTFLLLKNRQHFPHLSPALGTRFCGNGDLLGFVTRSHVTVNGRRQVRRLEPSRGPVITTAVRVADTQRAAGHYVEDGGFPEFVGWMLEARDMQGTVGRVARFLARRVWAFATSDPKSDYSAQLLALLGDGALASGTMPLLGMGLDTPDGLMQLRRGYLRVRWTTRTSRAYFNRVRQTMQQIATHLDADFEDNPIWFLRRVITVHPLGGCPMGPDARRGVVDDRGQVFNYPGLYITDGSVMPGPIGANPALTIAALADRAADQFAPRAARPRG